MCNERVVARCTGAGHQLARIGVLWHTANAEEDVYLSVMTKAFADFGYVDGKKPFSSNTRFPAEQPDRFRAFAREFVESKVDAILAATSLGAKEAKQATLSAPV